MNRIYRLVWNSALRVVQVTSELERSSGGSGIAGVSPPRKHPLVLACAAALALGAFALPAWSTSCTSWTSATGAAGSNATSAGGNGGNGSPAKPSVGSGYYCLSSGNTLAGGNAGNGGVGGTGGANGGTGGAGGNGGYGGNGVDVSATNPTLANYGAITGGAGGVGATGGTGGAGGSSNGYGGAGGNGGVGRSGGIGISGTGFTLNNTYGAAITGGTGGNGGSGGNGGVGATIGIDTFPGGVGGNGGNGGAGGAGVSGSGFTLTNNAGHILGGNGGGGGSGGNGRTTAGSYGIGGSGVSGSGFTLTNPGLNGYIQGGNGSIGGAGVSGSGFTLSTSTIIAGGNGFSGLGGAAVVSTGNSSVTASINARIFGGLAANHTASDAVDFSGGGNTLTLQSSVLISGNIVSTSGATNGGDTLALGGDTSASFNVSQLVASYPQGWTGAVQYFGFHQFAKTGASTWTLTGSMSVSAPWTISSGTLALGSANALIYSNVSNASTLAFANGVASGNVSGYAQTSTGTLSLNATATTCDTLAASSNASLGGTLNVAFSAAPATGFSCTILTAPAITGTFASVNVTGLSAGQPTSVIYNPGSVVLTIGIVDEIFKNGFEP